MAVQLLGLVINAQIYHAVNGYSTPCTSDNYNPCFEGLSLTNNKCCYRICADCYTSTKGSCLSCKPGYYFLTQTCISSCPLGFISSNSICTNSFGKIIDIKLDSIQDQVQSLCSDIIFSTGPDTNFYPSTTINDPIPSLQRGYYFKSTSYMQSSDLILNYNFTMIFYIKVLSGGVIASKESFSLNSKTSLDLKISSSSFSYLPIRSDWIKISLYVHTDYTEKITCTIKVNTDANQVFTASSDIFLDDNSGLYLGSPSESFNGFLWKYQVFSNELAIIAYTVNACTTSTSTDCVNNCDFSKYFFGNECVNCLDECTDGCARDSDCNLCNDYYCSSCSGFNAICSICKTSFTLINGVCACNDEYFIDEISGYCLKCDPKCKTCKGTSTYCVECSSSMIFDANTCSCPSGQYWDGLSCDFCPSTCTSCKDENPSYCLKCVTELILYDDNTCHCQEGYYFNSKSCVNCDKTCTDCIGPLNTDCISCPINSSLQMDSSCQCDEGYFLISGQCYPCHETCSRCYGINYDNCESCYINAYYKDDQCICNDGYFWSGYSCQKCYEMCAQCDWDLNTSCTSCGENAYLINGMCVCQDGYTWNYGVCTKCNVTCANCDGNENLCTSCLSNMLLSSSNCICNDGFYWDSAECRPCSSPCKTCTANNKCLSCIESTYLEDENCLCDDGYYWETSMCKSCHNLCNKCFGDKVYECLKCRKVSISSICVEQCPLGYTEFSGSCVMGSEFLSLNYVFLNTTGIIVDTVNGVRALTGISESFYPDYDPYDPYVADGRGYYFNSSSITFPYQQSLVLLPLTFSIALWLNPYSLSSPLLYKESNSTPIFSLQITNLALSLTLIVNQESLSFTSQTQLELEKWNFILITVLYETMTSLRISINHNPTESSSNSSMIFQDIQNSPIILGTEKYTSFYIGFIYQLDIYVSLLSISIIYNPISMCYIHPMLQTCIPICNFEYYYDKNNDTCYECLESCQFGCKNSYDCSICADYNCLACSSLTKYSCTKCQEPYILKNSICELCSDGYYYSFHSKNCLKCSSLCNLCIDDSKCLVCKDQSSLGQDKICYCNVGCSKNNEECERNSFKAIITVSSDNIIKMIFTEDIERLDKNQIKIYVEDKSQEFIINTINKSIYEIVIQFTFDVAFDTKVCILLDPLLTSIKNSLISNNKVLGTLFAQSKGVGTAKTTMINNFASKLSVAIASITIGTSLVNFNPASLFNVMNAVEIFSFILIYNITIESQLKSFLFSLRFLSNIPNPMLYFVPESLGESIPDKYKQIDYKTSLFIINSGISIVFMISYLLFCLASLAFKYTIKSQLVSLYTKKVLSSLKYTFFLRFWIQTSLEFLMTSIISIRYTKTSNFFEILDISISCLIAVKSI